MEECRAQLGEFASLVRRQVAITPAGLYRTLGCRLYGAGVYPREAKVGAAIQADRMYLVQEGDLVINRIWAQKGSAGIVPTNIAGSVVTADFPVMELDRER